MLSVCDDANFYTSGHRQEAPMANEQPSSREPLRQAAVNTSLPPLYKNPVTPDSQEHANLALKPDRGYGFAANINAIPIAMAEFAEICHFYPIVFSPDESATPLALVGLRDDENLFVNEEGEWRKDAYIPAYIRRYPFILSKNPGGNDFALCVDMIDEVIEENGGQKLFDDNGNISQMVQESLAFCISFQDEIEKTMEFSRALAQSGILTRRKLSLDGPDDTRLTFSGFSVVNQDKLAALSDEEFLEWRHKDWLPHLYAHLISADTQVTELIALLDKRAEKELSTRLHS